MNVQEIRRKLETIVEKPVELIRLTSEEWREALLSEAHQEPGADERTLEQTEAAALHTGAVIGGATLFGGIFGGAAQKEAVFFRIEDEGIDPAQRRLIGLLVEAALSGGTDSAANEETEVQQLGRWLTEQLEQETSVDELPDRLLLKSRLFTEMIPFLLICEGAQNSLGGYEELHQLLTTFLERDVIVVPLHGREWLLLVDRLEVLEVSEERGEDEESDRELLQAFGLGLYELIASEWTGIFNLSVAEPLQPAHGLVAALRILRESVFLGRTFHVTRNVHLPWDLGLERLVNSIPIDQRLSFMENVLGREDVLSDSELLTTLETFFQMNCNVSETAKRLYIHRNTLIYRLDKVKHETGLDVRNFGDAVLMKLALLLDKVTKD
ncbi:helix-turn-helix domain-containing protein [Saccharibacillus sp. CPCC 101409]|uniref:PucR family transcriptional regulator n=1 Tax=Saccharibacillus sp. CPCC 101409 TaxID=3058041 RepID=UPI0026724747|nr:helix-turn-helix domain-containing protein [Saccharibacillus sp. CPCC 101409]MDO3413132.1 helix-turn-helix domain-containing protein [Saccharibacillus sp. CPCC 101409]